MSVKIEHDRLKPFGVEAAIDLTAGTSALRQLEKDELRRLYALEGVLVLRNLRLTMDEQIDLCSIFGPVLRGSRENYIVSNVREMGCSVIRSSFFIRTLPMCPPPTRAARSMLWTCQAE